MTSLQIRGWAGSTGTPAALLLVVAGCPAVPPPEAPAPRDLELAVPATVAVAVAAELLASIGWGVHQEHDYLLRAEHAATGDANGEWMVCESGVGARGDTRRVTRELSSLVVATVRAVPSDTLAQLTISAAVPAATSPYGWAGEGPRRVSVHRCVSSGRLEAWLGEALAERFDRGAGPIQEAPADASA